MAKDSLKDSNFANYCFKIEFQKKVIEYLSYYYTKNI